MATESPNPYESPRETTIASEDRFVRRYFPALGIALVLGFVVSTIFPLAGVPLTLIAVPALVRATRIYWRRRQAADEVDWTDRVGVFIISLAVVFPISLVGGIAFCCVCTPTGYVVFSATYPGRTSLTNMLMFGAMYLGLAAGISASLFMLKRLHYMTDVEKQALAAAAEAEAADPQSSAETPS